jgi:raffinose/stachyose/melibiose transport system substrate-binding protein
VDEDAHTTGDPLKASGKGGGFMVSIGWHRRAGTILPAARFATAAATAILVAACAAPGAVSTPSPTTAATPAGSSGGQSSTAPSSSAAAAGPNCGTDPVELNAYFETGFDLPFKLSDEFTKQFPNVTWKISQDQFTNLMTATPRLLSGDNPPDLIRLPSMVSLVKDGLLKNLDDYVTAFGWDKFPAAQLAQNRVAADGTRGSGSLYAAGLNYSLTGVFYNKKLAEQVGMTAAPTTVAEFEDVLAKAKTRGVQPIMAWNATASGGGLAFPLQNLMAAYGPTDPINDWIFQKADATIDTPTNLTAAQHLEQWVKAGYFPKDVNAIEYTDARAGSARARAVHVQRRLAGRRLRQGPQDNVGFFVFPSAESGASSRRCRPADLRHRRQGEERRLRGLLPQLGRDQRQGPRDRRRRRRLESRRPARPARPDGRRQAR